MLPLLSRPRRSMRWRFFLVGQAAFLAALLFGMWVFAAQRAALTRSARRLLPVAGAFLLRFGAVRALNAAIPPAWLIAVQTYRVGGVMFLWPFLSHGVLPAGFAVPAALGDFITGAAAPFVAYAMARGRPGARRWAVAWNGFGVLDLIVAPTAAVLSHAPVTSIYPLGLIPLFIGPPPGIIVHLCSLRNLAANRGVEPTMIEAQSTAQAASSPAAARALSPSDLR